MGMLSKDSGLWGTMLVAIVFGMVGAIGTVLVTQQLHRTPQVVVMDGEQLVNAYVKGLMMDVTSGRVMGSESEIRKASAAFAGKMENVVADVAKTNNYLVIHKAAIISGEYVDITGQIAQQLELNLAVNDRSPVELAQALGERNRKELP